MKNKSISDLYWSGYYAAKKKALLKVEKMARTILKTHSNLDEFIMAMGTCFFTKKNGEIIHDYMQPKYMQPLDNFIIKWDQYLQLTGEPMRFTATGKKITEW